MKIEHVFFDLDGTITDSMPGITRAVQYALRHYGIHVEDPNELKPFVGPPLPDSFMRFYQFSHEDAMKAIDVFREYYLARGWLESAVYPGIEDTLRLLKENGKKLYIATSKPEVMARMVLEYYGLAGYFEYIGGAIDDNNRARKDEVISYVMETCGITDPKTIVMVGDRSHDIEGARKNGIDAVGILHGYGDRNELENAGACRIVEDAETLGKLLVTM